MLRCSVSVEKHGERLVSSSKRRRREQGGGSSLMETGCKEGKPPRARWFLASCIDKSREVHYDAPMTTTTMHHNAQCRAIGYRGARCSHAAKLGQLCARHSTYAKRPNAPAYLTRYLAEPPSTALLSALPHIEARLAALGSKAGSLSISLSWDGARLVVTRVDSHATPARR